ncbi:glycosyltransferase family 4 protein [Microcoleus sp. A2-C5]|uniref:glycosyltransferase family 4 protein n=1 Tax=unclassified Microcoleus TaxID=2642155 RepID=UPI002FCFA92E
MNQAKIHFIQPQLSHISGGSIYNLEIVKRLEQSARGKGFFHSLNSPVTELFEYFNTLPDSCIFILDGLYLANSEFKASLQQFLPYTQRTYLMLHYLESMNTYYSSQEKEALWNGEKQWLKAMQGIIIPSFQLRDYLSNHGVENHKIAVAFPGIAKAQEDRLSKPKKNDLNRPIKLIAVGTICQRKGQLELVQMLTQIKIKNFILHLVGDYEQESSYTQQIVSLIKVASMEDSIILHGGIPQQTLFNLLPECALYLSSSTYETYSMATAEAVVHGLPILAYATGAIGDWIENNVNGILIELGKQEQFSWWLRRLLTHDTELNQLQKKALHRSANLSFKSWDKTYQDFLLAFTNGI